MTSRQSCSPTSTPDKKKCATPSKDCQEECKDSCMGADMCATSMNKPTTGCQPCAGSPKSTMATGTEGSTREKECPAKKPASDRAAKEKPARASHEKKSRERNREKPQRASKRSPRPAKEASPKRVESSQRPERDPTKFYFHPNYLGMNAKIGSALRQLKEGAMITIEAYGTCVDKVISMTEILKARLGMLHQETCFISKTLQSYRMAEDDSRPPKKMPGLMVKLCTRPCLDTGSPGYQKPEPATMPIQGKYFFMMIVY